MQQWIIDNLSIIITSLTTGGFGIGYFNERNQRRINEKKGTAAALKTMQEAYDTFANDFIQKYNILKGDIQTLKNELRDVYEQLASEKLKNKTLEYQIELLKNKIK